MKIKAHAIQFNNWRQKNTHQELVGVNQTTREERCFPKRNLRTPFPKFETFLQRVIERQHKKKKQGFSYHDVVRELFGELPDEVDDFVVVGDKTL